MVRTFGRLIFYSEKNILKFSTQARINGSNHILMQKNFATCVLPYDVREVVRDAHPEFLSYDIEQIETMDYAILERSPEESRQCKVVHTIENIQDLVWKNWFNGWDVFVCFLVDKNNIDAAKLLSKFSNKEKISSFCNGRHRPRNNFKFVSNSL